MKTLTTGMHPCTTNPQWEVIAKYLPVQRKRQINLREVIAAIRCGVGTGLQWLTWPKNFPQRDQGYDGFQVQIYKNTLLESSAVLTELVRMIAKKVKSKPLILIIRSLNHLPPSRKPLIFDEDKKMDLWRGGKTRKKLGRQLRNFKSLSITQRINNAMPTAFRAHHSGTVSTTRSTLRVW